jgi:hypothetical protein
VSRPMRDLVGGVVDRARPRGYVGEPPEPWWLGVHLLVPGAKDWAQASVDREPEARASPKQRQRV